MNPLGSILELMFANAGNRRPNEPILPVSQSISQIPEKKARPYRNALDARIHDSRGAYISI